jgi:hypothetical protein
VWVADPFQRGAEVLVWPCSPVEFEGRLRCLEGIDPEGRGVPVSNWTKIGIVRDDHVTQVRLPPLQTVLLQGSDEDLQKDGVPVPMWVLACDPGVCPIFEAVRADPKPATEAYARVARWLADPESLAGQGPRDQVSVALKFYQLAGTDTERTSVPQVDPLGRREFPDQNLIRWRFRVQDGSPTAEDNVDWDVRVRYTAGRIVQRTFADGFLEVTWTPGPTPRVGSMIIAVSDGRGGTTAVSVELPAGLGGSVAQQPPIAEPTLSVDTGAPDTGVP